MTTEAEATWMRVVDKMKKEDQIVYYMRGAR